MALLSVIPFRRDDVIVCPAPLFHSFGLLTLTVGALLGATLVLPDRFDPEETLDLIERHRATASSLVPVMLRRIVTLPEGTLARHDVSSMRILLVSGSATPPELREAASALFGPVLHDLYGSTEAGWVSVATPEDAADHPASVGLPVPGVEVAVLDDAGRPLPAGQAGVLHVRSGAVFEGYTSGERAEARGGFLSLGDLGWLDEDGRLHVAGRADDMVVVGGENVYPAEVEEVLRALPGVEDVAVAGVPDEEFGQVLAAFVVGSVEPHDVIEGSRSRLASYKVPRHVRSVDELPRNASGKVLARELAVWLEGSPEKE
jgi:fatty-acyl-CoA synthase